MSFIVILKSQKFEKVDYIGHSSFKEYKASKSYSVCMISLKSTRENAHIKGGATFRNLPRATKVDVRRKLIQQCEWIKALRCMFGSYSCDTRKLLQVN